MKRRSIFFIFMLLTILTACGKKGNTGAPAPTTEPTATPTEVTTPTADVTGAPEPTYTPEEIFEYEISNDKVTITGLKVATLENIVIPEVLENCPVTAIGYRAFVGNDCMKSIAIPDSVEAIGAASFQACKALNSIVIPKSVTRIERDTFKNCFGLTEVSIPNGVKYIGTNAFECCKELTSIHIPDSVTEIGHETFQKCAKLEIVHLPNKLLVIDDRLFFECSNLKSIEIPDSVELIGISSFSNCEALQSIQLSKKLWEIQEDAFFGCSALESIELPKGLARIGNNAFRMCSALKSIEIPSKVNTIGALAFMGCEELENVTIQNGVKAIGVRAFYWCTALKEIVIPESVTDIYDEAFVECTALEKVTIQNANVKMGENVFQFSPASVTIGCPFMYTITGSTVMITGVKDKSIETLVIPDTLCGYPVTAIGDSAFLSSREAPLELKSIEFPSGLKSIGREAFKYNSSLKELILPEGVTSIGDEAFYGCNYLEKVYIPNSVIAIGMDAFNWCYRVKEYSVPEQFKVIKSRNSDENYKSYTDLFGRLFRTEEVKYESNGYRKEEVRNYIPEEETRSDGHSYEVIDTIATTWYDGAGNVKLKCKIEYDHKDYQIKKRYYSSAGELIREIISTPKGCIGYDSAGNTVFSYLVGRELQYVKDGNDDTAIMEYHGTELVRKITSEYCGAKIYEGEEAIRTNSPTIELAFRTNESGAWHYSYDYELNDELYYKESDPETNLVLNRCYALILSDVASYIGTFRLPFDMYYTLD